MRARLLRYGELEGVLRVGDATLDERESIDALFGRKPSAGRLSIDLRQLERVLQNAGIAGSLIDALEALEGPILLEREASIADEAAWTAVTTLLRTAVANDVSWLQSWCNDLLESGILRRLSRGSHTDAGRWTEQSIGILRRLPYSGVRLAHLAAGSCGDSHEIGRAHV